MSKEDHIADAEEDFLVLSVTPDMCKVGKSIVAFEPYQTLVPEKANYSKTVFARSEKILLADDGEETSSIINGMKGNAGKGIKSGVSGKKGNAEIRINERTVWIENRRTAAHGDEADINGKVK